MQARQPARVTSAPRWHDVAAAVAPRPCAGCRGGSGPWCRTCASSLVGPAVRAALPAGSERLGPVLARAAYAGPLREALVAFKDHGRWSLREPLGAALAVPLAALLLEDHHSGAVLVPVAPSPGSVRARDGDHVRELAQVAAHHLRACGVDVRVVRGLVGVRRRRDQVGLGRVDRAANLDGSMRAAAVLDRRDLVILVDDLVTTGSTLREATRALRAVGVEPRGAAVVAATGTTSAGRRWTG